MPEKLLERQRLKDHDKSRVTDSDRTQTIPGRRQVIIASAVTEAEAEPPGTYS